MLKQLFKKLQKIPISIEIKHFLVFHYIIRPIYKLFIFKKQVSKANKILVDFCIQNKRKNFQRKNDSDWK